MTPINKPFSKWTEYTDELAQEICARLSDGESLIHICDSERMPTRQTVLNWRNKRPEFDAMYLNARREQAEFYAEKGLELAMNAKDAGLGRLAWDALRWTAGRLRPDLYGDKLQHANAAGDGDQVTIVEYRWTDPKLIEGNDS